MLSRRDPAENERGGGGELNTIIGRGSVFEGTLRVQSSMRIDGKVIGNVHVSDSLIVGKEGEVNGEIHVRNAIIGGKVRDKIQASGKVVLEAKSAVYGEIITTRLVIDEGAIFEGKCTMDENSDRNAMTNQSGHPSRRGAPMEVQGRREMAASR